MFRASDYVWDELCPCFLPMARTKHDEHPYFARLAKTIVWEDLDPFQAATKLELGLTTAEAEAAFKNPLFQKLLRAERIKQDNEIADDPNRGKSTTIGRILRLADKMEHAKQFDKAATALVNLAKIEGHLGPESTVNIFGSLNAKDIQEMKEKLRKEQAEQGLIN